MKLPEKTHMDVILLNKTFANQSILMNSPTGKSLTIQTLVSTITGNYIPANTNRMVKTRIELTVNGGTVRLNF